MNKEELEEIRVLLLIAYAMIPSGKNCLEGERKTLAINCIGAYDRVGRALDLILAAVNKP